MRFVTALSPTSGSLCGGVESIWRDLEIRTTPALLALLVGGGCASQSPTTFSEGIVAPRSIDEASKALQGDCYGAEAEGTDEFLHPSRILDAVDAWIVVSSIEMEEGTPPLFDRRVTIAISGAIESGADNIPVASSEQLQPFHLDTDELTPQVVDWALAEGHGVHVAAQSVEYVEGTRFLNSATIVELPDIGPVFVGECGGLSLDRPMREDLGEDFEESIRLLTTTPGSVAHLYPPRVDDE